LNPALVISLAINFIPQIFETWNRVNLAARARSVSRKRKNLHTVITTAYLELQALFSCLLYQAETTRQAVLNRSNAEKHDIIAEQ
jgi:biotin transport system permease protein